MEIGLCPVCEEGVLKEVSQLNKLSFHGSEIEYVSLHSECSVCGSVLANARQVEQNRLAVIAAENKFLAAVNVPFAFQLCEKPEGQNPTPCTVINRSDLTVWIHEVVATHFSARQWQHLLHPLPVAAKAVAGREKDVVTLDTIVVAYSAESCVNVELHGATNPTVTASFCSMQNERRKTERYYRTH